MGGDDLMPDLHGWQNPIAKVTITRVDESADRLVAPLSGGGSVPSVKTYATGHMELRIDWEHQTLHSSLFVNGLSGVTQAHVHAGLPSESGPPVAFLIWSHAANGSGGGFALPHSHRHGRFTE